jgi:hypothetical protein
MNFRIPDFVFTAWDRFEDWSNVPLRKLGRFEVRRIDVLLVVFGVGTFVYYLAFHSWQWAVTGTLFYVLVTMLALWFF